MKKIYFILLLLTTFLLVNVKADENIFKCESEEKQRLKNLASKLEYTYDYKETTGGIIDFSITISNLHEDLKIIITDDLARSDKEFKYNDSKKATLSGFSSGQRVNLAIKGFVVNWCSGETIATKSIKLPYYNYYYDEEFCNENADFKYCDRLLNTRITQDEYYSAYNRYLKSKENIDEPEKNETVKEDNWNLLIIVGSIVGVLLVIVLVSLIIIRRRRKNSL